MGFPGIANVTAMAYWSPCPKCGRHLGTNKGRAPDDPAVMKCNPPNGCGWTGTREEVTLLPKLPDVAAQDAIESLCVLMGQTGNFAEQLAKAKE